MEEHATQDQHSFTHVIEELLSITVFYVLLCALTISTNQKSNPTINKQDCIAVFWS